MHLYPMQGAFCSTEICNALFNSQNTLLCEQRKLSIHAKSRHRQLYAAQRQVRSLHRKCPLRIRCLAMGAKHQWQASRRAYRAQIHLDRAHAPYMTPETVRLLDRQIALCIIAACEGEPGSAVSHGASQRTLSCEDCLGSQQSAIERDAHHSGSSVASTKPFARVIAVRPRHRAAIGLTSS